MTTPGLVRANNLSDLTNVSEAWDNLADELDYSYNAQRANYVNNSAVIRQDEKSNVVVAQSSGIPLSYGAQYVYKITEQAGTAIPFPFGYLRAATTSANYANLDWRLNVSNGPVVGSILLKAGTHSFVGMALRPGNGGNFFKDTNYPFFGIDLLTGNRQDCFGNGKPYEIMGAVEEDDGWWRVSMSSICQQAYGTASIDLIFLQQGNLGVVPNASSIDGSKFFYAALPQIETGHEPSPIIITISEQPASRATVATSASGLSFGGEDINAIRGLANIGTTNLLLASSLLRAAQPRISQLQASGQAVVASGANCLPIVSPSSTGTYVVSGLVASGYSVRGNAVGTVSGSPISGTTATVPMEIDGLIPQAWKADAAFASGSLASPSLAIPVEYDGFYVAIVVGQS